MEKLYELIEGWKGEKKDVPIDTKSFALVLLLFFPLYFYFFYRYLPQVPNDWTHVFYAVAKTPFAPYGNEGYMNPPWLALFLSPVSYLPLQWSRALNASFALFFLFLLAIRSGGNAWSLVMIITSYPFLALLAGGNIDWIIAASILLASKWVVPLVLIKPQVGVFLILIWFKQSVHKKSFFLFFAVFLSASFFIWQGWIMQMISNIQVRPLEAWNSSLFPWSIPLGIVFFYFSWKREDELIALGASLCFAPYFAIYSTIVIYVILSGRYKKTAFILWLLMWGMHVAGLFPSI